MYYLSVSFRNTEDDQMCASKMFECGKNSFYGMYESVRIILIHIVCQRENKSIVYSVNLKWLAFFKIKSEPDFLNK